MADNLHNESAEEWRDIPEWPGYQASSHGRIRSFKRWPKGRIAKQCADIRTGYKRVNLRSPDGNNRAVKVHRLICAAFHGPSPTDKPEVAHRDGTRDNNQPDNLRWASRKENVADQMAHGTFNFPCGRKRRAATT
jgi:hypothetical protein